MTTTLLLRLEGPVQAWGSPGARWEHRPSEMRPTKSGVVGMIANALGRGMSDSNADLHTLRFGVRADRPGDVVKEIQTAGGGRFPLDGLTALRNPELFANPEAFVYGAPRAPVNDEYGNLRAKYGTKERETVMKEVQVLTDAGFIVGLSGEASLLTQIADALMCPARLLTLGRRSCPPAYPLVLERDVSADWIETYPLLETATVANPVAVVEDPGGVWLAEGQRMVTDDGDIRYGRVPLRMMCVRPPLRQVHVAPSPV